VGEYFADLLVENKIVVELKAVAELNEIHQAQLMNYLVACTKRCGLLINFEKPRIEIKRILNGY
jgi:GxxExxY protein